MQPWTENVKTILNWIFAGFGIFLIGEELLLFFKRPTNFEESSTKMDFSFVPNIVFCPEPAFDLEIMQNLGYTGARNSVPLENEWFSLGSCKKV